MNIGTKSTERIISQMSRGVFQLQSRSQHYFSHSIPRSSSLPITCSISHSTVSTLSSSSSLSKNRLRNNVIGSGVRWTSNMTESGKSHLDQARRAFEASQHKLYAERAKRNRTILLYSAGSLLIALGVTYAAVPLYRAFCSATGYSGTPMTDPTRFTADRLYPTSSTRDRRITVRFEATSSDTLPWSFSPQQRSVVVSPGETALAFYKAKNEGNKDLIGIATYNMTPEKIAPYFAKVECFCFEEQKIRAGEEVDLPVFFFIDRDIVDDPTLDDIDDVVLSYTFFKARRNDRGHLVPDAPEDVVIKSQGFENYPLARPAPTTTNP